tara:strand:- start:443 stop:625 length:183 start_codon:yes stop_codon:yes gene_type:complete
MGDRREEQEEELEGLAQIFEGDEFKIVEKEPLFVIDITVSAARCLFCVHCTARFLTPGRR